MADEIFDIEGLQDADKGLNSIQGSLEEVTVSTNKWTEAAAIAGKTVGGVTKGFINLYKSIINLAKKAALGAIIEGVALLGKGFGKLMKVGPAVVGMLKDLAESAIGGGFALKKLISPLQVISDFFGMFVERQQMAVEMSMQFGDSAANAIQQASDGARRYGMDLQTIVAGQEAMLESVHVLPGELGAMTDQMAMFSKATIVSTDTMGGLLAKAKAFSPDLDMKGIIGDMSAAQKAIGLSKNQMTVLVEESGKAADRFTQFGSGTNQKQLKNYTKGLMTISKTYKKLGLDVQSAIELTEKLTNPEQFEDNAYLISQMGISMQEYMDMLEGGDASFVQEKMASGLYDIAQQAKDMSFFQKKAYADSLNVSVKELNRLGKMSRAEFEDTQAAGGDQADATVSQTEKAMGSLQSMMNRVAEAFNQFGTGLAEKIVPVMEKIFQFLPKVIDAASFFWDFIFGGSTDISKVENIFDEIFGVIQNVIPKALDFIASAVPNLLSRVVQVATALLPKALDTLLSLITTILDSNIIPKIINSIIELLTKDLLPKIPELLQKVADFLIKTIPVLLVAVEKIVYQLMDIILDFFTGEGFTKLIDTTIDMVVKLVENIGAMLPSLLTKLLEIFVTVFIKVINLVTTLLPQLIDVVIDIVNKLVSTIITFLESGALGNIIESLINAAITLFETLIKVAVKLLPALINAAIKIAVSLVKAISDFIKSPNFSKILNTLIKVVLDGVITLVNAVANLLPVLVTAVMDIAIALLDAIIDFVMGGGLVKLIKALVFAVIKIGQSLAIYIKGVLMIWWGYIKLAGAVIWSSIVAYAKFYWKVITFLPKKVFGVLKSVGTKILGWIGSFAPGAVKLIKGIIFKAIEVITAPFKWVFKKLGIGKNKATELSKEEQKAAEAAQKAAALAAKENKKNVEQNVNNIKKANKEIDKSNKEVSTIPVTSTSKSLSSGTEEPAGTMNKADSVEMVQKIASMRDMDQASKNASRIAETLKVVSTWKAHIEAIDIAKINSVAQSIGDVIAAQGSLAAFETTQKIKIGDGTLQVKMTADAEVMKGITGDTGSIQSMIKEIRDDIRKISGITKKGVDNAVLTSTFERAEKEGQGT